MSNKLNNTTFLEMRKPCVIFYLGEQCCLPATRFARWLACPHFCYPVFSRADISQRLINQCRRQICLYPKQPTDTFLLEDAFIYIVQRLVTPSSNNLNSSLYTFVKAAHINNFQTSPILRSIAPLPMIV